LFLPLDITQRFSAAYRMEARLFFSLTPASQHLTLANAALASAVLGGLEMAARAAEALGKDTPEVRQDDYISLPGGSRSIGVKLRGGTKKLEIKIASERHPDSTSALCQHWTKFSKKVKSGEAANPTILADTLAEILAHQSHVESTAVIQRLRQMPPNRQCDVVAMKKSRRQISLSGGVCVEEADITVWLTQAPSHVVMYRSWCFEGSGAGSELLQAMGQSALVYVQSNFGPDRPECSVVPGGYPGFVDVCVLALRSKPSAL